MQKALPKRILIVRLSALGDVIQTLPVIAMIKAENPDTVIGWLVEADAEVILKDNPLIDHLHVSQRKQWTKALFNPFQWFRTFHEINRFIHSIRTVEYDAAMDFQGLFKSGFTLFLTGIKRRIGFLGAREMATLFYSEKVPVDQATYFDPNIPIVNHFAAMVQSVGFTGQTMAYPLPSITPNRQEAIRKHLAGFSSEHPLIVLAPATQWQSKHWPSPYWTQLIDTLLASTHANIIVIGSQKDKSLIEDILTPITQERLQQRLINLAGQTSLLDLQALFTAANLLIGLDSAPIHLAGAVDHAHLIGIYGPTGYRRTPPPGHKAIFLSSEGELPCQPCDARECPLGTTECMQRITPDKVLQTVRSILVSDPVLL